MDVQKLRRMHSIKDDLKESVRRCRTGLFGTDWLETLSLTRIKMGKAGDTVEPLLYDHPQNHIGVVI